MKLAVNGKSAFAYTGTRDFNVALPTAVFIHGAANDHSVWSLQSRYFAFHGWNVLALDLPGHGQSEGEPCTTIGDYAEWVATFLDAVSEPMLCPTATATRTPTASKNVATHSA